MVPDTARGGDVLVTRQLVSGYGRIETLHGIDIHVPSTGVTAIVGPNGSGKTTFLKTVMGLVRPWRGEVLFFGQPIAGKRAHDLVRLGMCMVPQGRVVFPMLTVQENLVMSAFTVADAALVRRRVTEAFELFPILGERRQQMASTLSGGEQEMLALAKVVMLRPRLLLLDEPSLGLAPKLVEAVYEKIRLLTESGIPTLIVEQNVRKVLEVASRVIVLVLGRVRYEGARADLERTVDLGRLFLGAEV